MCYKVPYRIPKVNSNMLTSLGSGFLLFCVASSERHGNLFCSHDTRFSSSICQRWHHLSFIHSTTIFTGVMGSALLLSRVVSPTFLLTEWSLLFFSQARWGAFSPKCFNLRRLVPVLPGSWTQEKISHLLQVVWAWGCKTPIFCHHTKKQMRG